MIKYRNPRMMTVRERELVYKRIQHHYGYNDYQIDKLKESRNDAQILTAAYYEDWKTTSHLAAEAFDEWRQKFFDGIDR